MNTFLKDKKALVIHSKINPKDKVCNLMGKVFFHMPWVKEAHLQLQAYLITLSKNTSLSTRRTKSINQTSVHRFHDHSCKTKWFVEASKQSEYIIALFWGYLSILVLQIRNLFLIESKRKLYAIQMFSFSPTRYFQWR